MDNTKHKIIADELIECLEQGFPIDEDLANALFLGIRELIEARSAADGSYEELAGLVESRYVYDDAGENQGFALGACWASMRLLEECLTDHEAERASALDCVSRYSAVIGAILARPDVTHGELCEILGESKSNLTQKMAAVKQHRLVVVRREGRYCHYSLSAFGEELWQEFDRSAKEIPSLPEQVKVNPYGLVLLKGGLARNDVARIGEEPVLSQYDLAQPFPRASPHEDGTMNNRVVA